MSIEFVRVDTLSTVFDVWKRILEKHPEVVKQTAKVYANRPHGETADQQVEVLPRERIVWSDDERSFWGQPNEIKAIGARVERRPQDYDSRIDYSGAGRWFNDGDVLDIDKGHERSFVMIDFESEPSKELLELTFKTLKDWRSDWYLLDSGGSFHLIIDKLVSPEILPKYFGQLIMDLARYLQSTKSMLYGHLGKYLIENCNDKRKLRLWIEDVLEKFGHKDEPINSGRLVFPIDMKWIAHVIEAIIDNNHNDGYLRVSSKHGSVPVLIAQQVEEHITIFQSSNASFNRNQPRLLGF